jgi:hypothetical protein
MQRTFFVAPTPQGQRRRILAVYLDPANFKNIGDGHTIATPDWAEFSPRRRMLRRGEHSNVGLRVFHNMQGNRNGARMAPFLKSKRENSV